MKQMHRLVVLLVLSIVLASCGGSPAASTTAVPAEPTAAVAEPTTAAEPTAEPTDVEPTEETAATVAPTEAASEETATSEETTTGDLPPEDQLIPQLQAVVDTWAAGYNELDVEKLRSAIDPKALSLRRTQGELFKYRTESMGGSMGFDMFARVMDVEPRDLGYVMAHVTLGNQTFPFLFKQVNGTWMMSEPKRAEIGKKQIKETEHFVFEYYPWDEQILPDIVELMESADELVVGKLGKGPEEKPLVRLIPTTELGNASGAALAYYVRVGGALNGQQMMVINSPDSYSGGGYAASEGWQPALEVTLAHEFTHLVVDCCFVPNVRQLDWMFEGIAEYISDGPVSRPGEVALAVRSDAIIPLRTSDTSNVYKQDMEHFTGLDKDKSLGYGLASSLVDYIVRTYGGLDGYWKLVEEYDRTQDFDKALQNVVGINIQQFEDGWKADLKNQFGG